jgi:disulfide oxidoreductase YuzD
VSYYFANNSAVLQNKNKEIVEWLKAGMEREDERFWHVPNSFTDNPEVFENKEVVEWLKAGMEREDERFWHVPNSLAKNPAVFENKEVVEWLKAGMERGDERFWYVPNHIAKNLAVFENKEIVEWLKAGMERGDERFRYLPNHIAKNPALFENKEVVKWAVGKAESSFSLSRDRFEEVIKIVGVTGEVGDGFRKEIIVQLYQHASTLSPEVLFASVAQSRGGRWEREMKEEVGEMIVERKDLNSQQIRLILQLLHSPDPSSDTTDV